MLAAASLSHGICLERLSGVSSWKSGWGWWEFLSLALRRAVWMRKAAVLGLVGCAGSASVICWLPRLLLRLIVRTQIQHSGSLVWWLGRRSRAAGRGNRYFYSEREGAQLPSHLFACASHQTRLVLTRSMARRPIKVRIRRGEGQERAEVEPCWSM